MLKKALHALGRVPSHRWLTAYLGALLLFGLGYSFLLPGSFYLPTAPLEPSTASYYDQLKSALTGLLNEFYIPPDSATLAATQGWRPTAGKTVVEDIVLPEGYLKGFRLHHHDNIPLELHISIPIENRSVGFGVVRCVSTLSVSRDALLMSFKLPRGTPDSLDFRRAGVYTWLPTRLEGVDITALRMGLAEPPRFEKAVQGYFVRQVMPEGDRYTPAITLPYEPRLLLFKYVRAMLGFPSDFKDNASRMMYLSAVTLTTLGYGDIVPLTSLARTLTAIEAVSGILLIGLFLNSLAREIIGSSGGTAGAR